MNSSPEPIQFSKPLRDVQLAGMAAPAPTAEEQRQAELKASYERGLLAGEKALTEKLLQQRAELNQLAHGLLESLRDAVPQVIRDTEQAMVSLALAVAQKVVADLPISVEMIEAAVKDALTQLEGSANFTVRLNRADLELLQKAGSPLLTPTDGRDFRFLVSPDVTRGGCIVETSFGIIDGRRETKLDLLQRSMAA